MTALVLSGLTVFVLLGICFWQQKLLQDRDRELAAADEERHQLRNQLASERRRRQRAEAICWRRTVGW